MNPLDRARTGSTPEVDAGRRSVAADRVVAVLQIVRLPTCLVAALSAVYGCFAAEAPVAAEPASCLLAALAMAAMMGFAHTVNDIVDLPVDRTAKPARPIPSGRLSVRAATAVAVVLAVMASACSAALGVGCLVGTSVLLGAALLYSARLKNTVLIGNVVVGSVCAATVVFGAAAVGRITASTLGTALVILLFMVAYELVKTLQDHESDAAAGVTTLATRHGPQATIWAYVAFSAAMSVSVGAVGVGTSIHVAYICVIVPCLLLPVWACAVLLLRSEDRAWAAALSLTVLRLTWLPGLTALALRS